MTKWIMEIYIETEPGKMEWRAVHPSHGKRYEYDTKEEAERMLRMCYGPPMLDSDHQRVREITA